ncbi:hypothetical protein HDV05_007941 [Chytridiales sp. JEL 0842]|nr:hypothetical protein HDV05_007941 [Chytridiales sp. JEL 0842]
MHVMDKLNEYQSDFKDSDDCEDRTEVKNGDQERADGVVDENGIDQSGAAFSPCDEPGESPNTLANVVDVEYRAAVIGVEPRYGHRKKALEARAAKSAANTPPPHSQAADPTADNAATSTATAPSSAADPPSTNETFDDADEVTEINNEHVMLPRNESVGNRWTASKISKAAPSSQAAATVKQTQKQKQTPEQDLAAFAKKNSAKEVEGPGRKKGGQNSVKDAIRSYQSYRSTANLCHFDVVLESVFAAFGLTENYKQLLLNTYHQCLACSEQSLGAQILGHFLDRARVSTRRSSPMPRRQKTSNTLADADNSVDLGDIKASAAAGKEITAARMQATLNTLADFMHTAKEKCHIYGFKKGVFGDPNASLRSVVALASCSDPTVLTPKTFPASTDFQTLSWQHPLAEMFVMRTGMISTVCEDCIVLTRDPILDIPVHFKETFQQFLEKLPASPQDTRIRSCDNIVESQSFVNTAMDP